MKSILTHLALNELLVKNAVIAFNPVDYKTAKLGIFPLQYPAILGSTFGGRVEAVGSQVTGFRIGEKVVAWRKSGVVGNQYGAYQRYVLVGGLSWPAKSRPTSTPPFRLVS